MTILWLPLELTETQTLKASSWASGLCERSLPAGRQGTDTLLSLLANFSCLVDQERILTTHFLISTATKTIELKPKVIASSIIVSGWVLKIGLRNGT